MHAKLLLFMHAARKIIWIQHIRYQPSRLVKGLVIGQTLIPICSVGVSNGVGYLFMYPQKAFIKKVNKLASCKNSSFSGISSLHVVIVVVSVRSKLWKKSRPGKESLPGGRARVLPRTVCSSHWWSKQCSN